MFQLTSQFQPTGDQPEAIRQLVDGLHAGAHAQTLLGVTGSGKTFTIANVIQQVQRPTLILSHNKTLAAQLYTEFKNFFPNNKVEYFVSYYDYYQPEAYIPSTDTYIEKDLSINDEIDRLRLSATASLLSGRRDIIVISSVSCLYGIGNPADFRENMIHIHQGEHIVRDELLRRLVNATYQRNDIELNRGCFRVKGDTVDIFLAYADYAVRVTFWGDEIDEILTFEPADNHVIEHYGEINIFPASIFVTTKERTMAAIRQIRIDLGERVEYLKQTDRPLEAKRLEERVNYDLEMIQELGYCSGIENYSRYFDGRAAGTPPFCLLNFFPDDFLTVIDESHVTLPQVHAMYGGDASRKQNLVEYGFRLPAARDNRPLTFDEFSRLTRQTIYVSATPGDYELEQSEGIVVDQLIRPTGLLDPEIDVRPSLNQIDDLLEEIARRTERDERTLVTTLTKRMAEELDEYLRHAGIRSAYIHSEVDTLDRVQIMQDLRKGLYDVLVGVNLLREGLDLPEVSLVAILDADKEGFLRNTRSLLQTAGRAARNVNGRVIMYADTITQSMQATIDETNRHRLKQMAYNTEHGITPQAIRKNIENPLATTTVEPNAYIETDHGVTLAADPVVQYMSKPALLKAIEKTKRDMQTAAKKLDFIEAARLRDEMIHLEDLLKEYNNPK